MSTAILLTLAGFVLLVLGGELVVRGAGGLALAFGIRPLVVGLTVVAFSTSAPELAASSAAVSGGHAAIAVGNVLGSNIANIGVILGLVGLYRTLPVESSFLQREIPAVIGSALLLLLVLYDAAMTRVEGVGLLVALAAYLVWLLRNATANPDPAIDAEVETTRGLTGAAMATRVAQLVGGVALLVFGADLLVGGASTLAGMVGVPEAFIGLTVVAIGTSLPELASSFAAARAGQVDLVLGNVVGSNIFNVLFILGLSAALFPFELEPGAFRSELWTNLALTIALAPLLRRGHALLRSEAALLLGAYLFWLVVLA